MESRAAPRQRPASRDELRELCLGIGKSFVHLETRDDFYVFDDQLGLFLHYARNGTNASFEITGCPLTARTCREAFETVWDLATPFRDYQPA